MGELSTALELTYNLFTQIRLDELESEAKQILLDAEAVGGGNVS